MIEQGAAPDPESRLDDGPLRQQGGALRDRDDQGRRAEHGLPGHRLGDPGLWRRRGHRRLWSRLRLCDGTRIAAGRRPRRGAQEPDRAARTAQIPRPGEPDRRLGRGVCRPTPHPASVSGRCGSHSAPATRAMAKNPAVSKALQPNPKADPILERLAGCAQRWSKRCRAAQGTGLEIRTPSVSSDTAWYQNMFYVNRLAVLLGKKLRQSYKRTSVRKRRRHRGVGKREPEGKQRRLRGRPPRNRQKGRQRKELEESERRLQHVKGRRRKRLQERRKPLDKLILPKRLLRTRPHEKLLMLLLLLPKSLPMKKQPELKLQSKQKRPPLLLANHSHRHSRNQRHSHNHYPPHHPIHSQHHQPMKLSTTVTLPSTPASKPSVPISGTASRKAIRNSSPKSATCAASYAPLSASSSKERAVTNNPPKMSAKPSPKPSLCPAHLSTSADYLAKPSTDALTKEWQVHRGSWRRPPDRAARSATAGPARDARSSRLR